MKTDLIRVLSYLFFVVGLLKIPEQFWDYLLLQISKITHFYLTRRHLIPVQGEIFSGEEMLLSLQDFEGKIALGIKILPESLPQYKFYTELLEHLFLAFRKMGVGIKKFIPEIRMALIHDLQFEKKIASEMISGILHFLVVTVTTWCFVYLSSLLINIPIAKSIVISMLGLQVAGIGLFIFGIARLKKSQFLKFNSSIKELYLFTSLLEVGLPLNETLAYSGILSGSLVKFKHFENLANRIKKLIERLKSTGISPKEESHEIIRELWHLQEQTFIKFAKNLQVLKFVILAFFYLPAYFLYLYSIFKFFMEQ